MLSLQHSHGYSGSFLNYITMDNRFLDLIERSIKEHWDLPAFSDYNGHTFHFKDVARRIEKFHILLEHAGIKKGDKVAIVGTQLLQLGNLLFRNIGLRGCCRADPARVQTRQYPSHRQPFGSKSRTGRLQQLGEHERKDDAGCQAVHDAGQLLHYRLQK